jgi:hypothetical protein
MDQSNLTAIFGDENLHGTEMTTILISSTYVQDEVVVKGLGGPYQGPDYAFQHSC